MFRGNVDDCFRIGVAVKNNTVRLYADFYSADIIVASPLGLRIIVGAEGCVTYFTFRKCSFFVK